MDYEFLCPCLFLREKKLFYDVGGYFCIIGTGKRNDCPFTLKGYFVVIFEKRN